MERLRDRLPEPWLTVTPLKAVSHKTIPFPPPTRLHSMHCSSLWPCRVDIRLSDWSLVTFVTLFLSSLPEWGETGAAWMARSNAMVLLVVVGVMASAAWAQPQQCNLKTLMPCLKAVRGPYPPQPDASCCGVAMDYNPACLCTEFVDSKDYPMSYIRNVLAIPRACGRYQLSGYRCGIYTIE